MPGKVQAINEALAHWAREVAGAGLCEPPPRRWAHSQGDARRASIRTAGVNWLKFDRRCGPSALRCRWDAHDAIRTDRGRTAGLRPGCGRILEIGKGRTGRIRTGVLAIWRPRATTSAYGSARPPPAEPANGITNSRHRLFRAHGATYNGPPTEKNESDRIEWLEQNAQRRSAVAELADAPLEGRGEPYPAHVH